MKKIVLISCVSKKQSKRSKAKDLYTSSLFSLSLKYAYKQRPDAIYVLSAKHGLLDLNRVVAPYDQVLRKSSVKDRKSWANKVLRQLQKIGSLQEDHFTILAGKSYREFLIPQLKSYEVPLEGLRIGKQLKFLKHQLKDEIICEKLHQYVNSINKKRFPFDKNKIPLNGIYILFEKREFGHGTNRIVRIGTHTGKDQLRARLKQHYIDENKDRSIFRKNIGRAILNRRKDKFLEYWNLDLTSRTARQKYGNSVDLRKQKQVEKKVTQYIQNNLSFVAFEVPEKSQRLRLESKIISTISWCTYCNPSSSWLGLNSPKLKIRESGLWLVNELYKKPLTETELKEFKKLPHTTDQL